MNQLFITGEMSYAPSDLSGEARIMRYETSATITMTLSKYGVKLVSKDYHYRITSMDPEDIFQEIERKRFGSYTKLFDNELDWNQNDSIQLQFDQDSEFILALVSYMKERNKSLIEFG